MTKPEPTSGRSPASGARVFALGLDGGTFNLLRPLIARGVMPHLGRMLARSSHGPLASTVPPLTSPAWASFATGKNPGKHGLLLFTQPDADPDAPPRLASAAQIDSRTLWEIAGDAGRRSITVNVPLTYPPRPVHGITITGMMTPRAAPTFTHPPDLPDRLPALQDYIIDVDLSDSSADLGQNQRFAEAPGAYLERVDRMRAARTAVALDLIQSEPWDLFTLVYTGTDRLSHFFWKELTALANGVAPDEVHFGARLLAYFRDLDADLGRLLESLDEDSYALVLSDHGFGPAAERAFYLNSWLQEAGLLQAARGETQWTNPSFWSVRLKRWPVIGPLVRAAARWLPAGLNARVRKEIVRGQDALFDRERSDAWTVPMASYVGGVRLRDDLPDGRRAAIVDRLLETLPEVVDPETGERVVRRACRRESLYHGPHAEEFPDVVVVADERYEIVSILLDRGFTAPKVLALRSGDHRDDGIFALTGPGVRTGQLQERWTLPDVTATLLHLLGVPLPDDLDGQVIAEALTSAFLAEHPVAHAPAKPYAPQQAELDLSEEDEEALLGRLKDLGYIE